MAGEAIVIVDESGDNRPSDQRDFSAAGLVFRADFVEYMRQASRRIGELLGKSDYKYRDISRSTEGRREFLALLNGSRCKVSAFGFYVGQGGLGAERNRERQAASAYGDNLDSPSRAEAGRRLSESPSGYYLDQCVDCMMPMLGHLWRTSKVGFDVYWDDRSDLERIERRWALKQEQFASVLSVKVDQVGARLLGPASGIHSPITRLAGILAGDLRQFFRMHGPRVWRHLDDSGLRGSVDPIRGPIDQDLGHCRVVGSETSRLADENPASAGEHCMLQGYSKRLLSDLLSFCDPDGRLGHVKILHGNHWQVLQQPD